jgi:hypothetical protein
MDSVSILLENMVQIMKDTDDVPKGLLADALKLLSDEGSSRLFIANGGVSVILTCLEASPERYNVSHVCFGLLHGIKGRELLGTCFPTADLRRRFFVAVAYALQMFGDKAIVVCILFIAVTVIKFHHSEETLADTFLEFAPDRPNVLLGVLKRYSDVSSPTVFDKTVVRIAMTLACWVIETYVRKRQSRNQSLRMRMRFGAGVIRLLTRVTGQSVETLSAVIVYLRCVIACVGDADTGFEDSEPAMQAFIDANGVKILLSAAELHSDAFSLFAPSLRKVLVSPRGRAQMFADGAMKCVMAGISRADNEKDFQVAVSPLTFEKALPSKEFMHAIEEAGGVTVFERILEVHYEKAFMCLTACLFLSLVDTPLSEACTELIRASRLRHSSVL